VNHVSPTRQGPAPQAIASTRRAARVQGNLREILVVGGAALNLAGWIPPRSTADVDVLASLDEEHDALARPDSPPPSFFEAVRTVARDFDLPEDWLNAEVAMQWETGLPPGSDEGIRWESFGSLQVGLAGRHTMLALKLFAAADRGRDSVHFQDLVALEPSPQELETAGVWVLDQDSNPGWPDHVDEVIEDVKRTLERD